METVPFQIKFIESIIILLLFSLVRMFIRKIIDRTLKKHDFSLQREKVTVKSINFFTLLLVITFLVGIWGMDGTQVLAFLTSALTVIGIAFFAQWSILSNITSGLILFFNHPLKIGDKIRIVDSEPKLEGKVEDISLFFMHIKNEDGITFSIPNSVVIQKTLVIIKEDTNAK